MIPKVSAKNYVAFWGCIFDKWLQMLLDTGTSKNLIAAEVVKSLGLEVRSHPETIVALVNGMALGSS